MKKKNILNLIKYHVEKKEILFRKEAVEIARYFDRIGDHELTEYIMALMSEANSYVPQTVDFESDFLKVVDVQNLEPLNLPTSIFEDLKGMMNAINHRVGINKFVFEGRPGSGKTEAAKQVARLLKRTLFVVNFENLIDAKLGQTNKNIAQLFSEINMIPTPEQVIILFDELDVIAMDRINNNDVREMGRATSTMLRELDKLRALKKEIVIIATTNLFYNFDKALVRRFDAVINFNRYTTEDLVNVGEAYFSSFIKNFENMPKDTRLFRKILRTAKELPYPGQLKNIIKTSLAFSDVGTEYNYLQRLYNTLIGDLNTKTLTELSAEGFTVREIEKLTGKSKSSVARQLKEESTNE